MYVAIGLDNYKKYGWPNSMHMRARMIVALAVHVLDGLHYTHPATVTIHHGIESYDVIEKCVRVRWGGGRKVKPRYMLYQEVLYDS